MVGQYPASRPLEREPYGAMHLFSSYENQQSGGSSTSIVQGHHKHESPVQLFPSLRHIPIIQDSCLTRRQILSSALGDCPSWLGTAKDHKPIWSSCPANGDGVRRLVQRAKVLATGLIRKDRQTDRIKQPAAHPRPSPHRNYTKSTSFSVPFAKAQPSHSRPLVPRPHLPSSPHLQKRCRRTHRSSPTHS